MNQHAKYLGQKSGCAKVTIIVRTHNVHIPGQLINLDH